MHAVIVTESCFGNTAAVADAIADGLQATGCQVQTHTAQQASAELTANLVLIAAPTHNAGLPKAKTRKQAAQKGATGVPDSGVREWIASLQRLDARVLTVSTTDGGKYAGSAGKAAVKALRRRKITAEHGQDFLVTATSGPLADGELDRARRWAQSLVN